MKKLLIFTLLIPVFIFSCVNNTKEKPFILTAPDLPNEVFDYLDIKSSNPSFTEEQILNQFELRDISNEKATLGRVLFYDSRLSINNKTSCGSCHQQVLGFSDNTAFSEGFNNQVTLRNSMSISNAMNNVRFFWDGRTQDLKELVLEPVQNHIEMGLEDLDYLNEKLSSIEYYNDLFEDAYGDDEITTERISESMAQFLNVMISANSPFDKQELSAVESEGFRLFEEFSCASCHRQPSLGFSWNGGSNTANIGLDEIYEDNGFGSMEHSKGMEGVFVVPSLRNIALSAPYMHDGRFANLDEVLDHYSSGIKNHENLDWRLKDFDPETGVISPLKMNMTDSEKFALKSFLIALTDEEFISDERYSDPFQ